MRPELVVLECDRTGCISGEASVCDVLNELEWLLSIRGVADWPEG